MPTRRKNLCKQSRKKPLSEASTSPTLRFLTPPIGSKAAHINCGQPRNSTEIRGFLVIARRSHRCRYHSEHYCEAASVTVVPMPGDYDVECSWRIVAVGVASLSAIRLTASYCCNGRCHTLKRSSHLCLSATVPTFSAGLSLA